MYPTLSTTTIYDFLGTAIVKSEKELFDFINSNLIDVVYVLYSNNNYITKYNNLFTNYKFLAIFHQVLVLQSSKGVNLENMSVYIDSIIYWYIVNKGEDEHEYIRTIWYMIAGVVNKEYVDRLKALHCLDTELCSFVAIANKCSLTDSTRIKSVIYTLCASASNVLTVENFKDIYSIFYLKNFKNLMITVLFDSSIVNDYNGENSPKSSLAMTNNYNAIMAILDILESLNTYDIIRYLRFVYEKFVNYNYDADILRVQFSNLSPQRYPKILLAAKTLKDDQMSLP